MSFGWLVYPSRNHQSLAVRTFIDFLLAEADNYPLCQPEGDVRGMPM